MRLGEVRHFFLVIAVVVFEALALAPSPSNLSHPESPRTPFVASDTIRYLLSPQSRPLTGKIPAKPTFPFFNSNIAFFPHYRCNIDIYSFTFHKDAFFRRQYLAATDLCLEADFIELSDKLIFGAFSNIRFGLGEVPGNVVFTLLNTATNLSLICKYRFNQVQTSFSMNHYCFHDIDDKLFPVIYFNTFRLSAASLFYCENDFWKHLPTGNSWIPCKQPSWNTQLSVYLKNFFGLVTPSKLNDFNDRVCEFKNFNRLALYNQRTIGAALTAEELLGYAELNDNDGKSLYYWRLNLCAELHLRGAGGGITLYTGYILDNMPPVIGYPRFSKDQLLQFGIRIMN
jgi:hypothetical protein